MSIHFQRFILASSLAFTGLVANAPLQLQPAYASDLGGCFMVDASGKTISLGRLCGEGGGNNASAATSSRPAAVAPAGRPASGVVTVPILRRSGMTPVIAVTFNGTKTYEMILDTGASGTLVTRAMADELRLKPNGAILASIADGSTVRFPTGRVNTIAVAAAQVQDVDVAIAENMNIGLLGHDFFGNYDIRIGKDVVEFSQR